MAITRAIVADPDLLFADEPTGNLDARSGKEILSILATLNKELKKTVVMVTHDLEKGVLLETALSAAD